MIAFSIGIVVGAIATVVIAAVVIFHNADIG